MRQFVLGNESGCWCWGLLLLSPGWWTLHIWVKCSVSPEVMTAVEGSCPIPRCAVDRSEIGTPICVYGSHILTSSSLSRSAVGELVDRYPNVPLLSFLHEVRSSVDIHKPGYMLISYIAILPISSRFTTILLTFCNLIEIPSVLPALCCLTNLDCWIAVVGCLGLVIVVFLGRHCWTPQCGHFSLLDRFFLFSSGLLFGLESSDFALFATISFWLSSFLSGDLRVFSF